MPVPIVYSTVMRDTNRYKYSMQKCIARKRGIDFNFTFEDWLSFWQASGHWEQRGRNKGQYVMSRYGDVGPYELGNVFIQLNADNSRDACKGVYRPGKTLSKHTCPHCGKIGDMGNLNRWHNNNCKQKSPN